MSKRKPSKIGKSFIPKPAKNPALRLGLTVRDRGYVGVTPDGPRFAPDDPEVIRQIEAAERILRRYRNAFRQLAR